MTSRILKQEVIDMADTMDIMTEFIQRQDQSMQDIKVLLHSLIGADKQVERSVSQSQEAENKSDENGSQDPGSLAP